MNMFKIPAAAVAAALLTVANAPGVFAHNGVDHQKGGHKDQHVTVTVDAKGYHPAMVNVKAGQEVHLDFVSKGAGCANEIRIPSLKKSISLKPGQKKDVIFTPGKGQTISFGCGMKMYKGKVMAK